MSNLFDQFGEKPNNWISMKEFDAAGGRNLTLRGLKKVVPDDEEFIITGTMNKIVKNNKGVAILTKTGDEIKNSYYDSKFPKGYQLTMEFDEGTVNVSSFPFLKAFNVLRPEVGQVVNIQRITPDGDKTKTQYSMKIIDTDFV
jgi:hypothetical protein